MRPQGVPAANARRGVEKTGQRPGGIQRTKRSSRPLHIQRRSRPHCATFSKALRAGNLTKAAAALRLFGQPNLLHNRFVCRGAHNASLVNITTQHGNGGGAGTAPMSPPTPLGNERVSEVSLAGRSTEPRGLRSGSSGLYTILGLDFGTLRLRAQEVRRRLGTVSGANRCAGQVLGGPGWGILR
jgi:hypothetical protein